MLDPSEYAESLGSDSVGSTVKSHRALFFRTDYVTPQVILHELYHAYFTVVPTASMGSLTPEQAEELSAEFFDANALKIVAESKKLFLKMHPNKTEAEAMWRKLEKLD